MTEYVPDFSGPRDHEDIFSLTVLTSRSGLLMGRKTRGFGAGKLVLPGGKHRYHIGSGGIADVRGDIDAAREVNQETGVNAHLVLQEAGRLTIVDEADGGDIRLVSIYAGQVDDTSVALRDSDELQEVGWYPEDTLPYPEMPTDYRTWLPEILAGYAVQATLYCEGERLLAGQVFRISPEPGVRAQEIPLVMA